jgi:outer membrane biosynthesis protein TonB
MFWDGERWLPGDKHPITAPEPSTPAKARDWASTAVMVLALMALVIPIQGASAARGTRTTEPTSMSTTSGVDVVQESSRQIKYSRGWTTADHPSYLGGHVRETKTAEARAALRFTGYSVKWIGPVGPTGGEAQVLVDGTPVASVNTFASSFTPSGVLFEKSWAASGSHRITIVAKVTDGRASVALDAFAVGGVMLDPGPDPTAPTPTLGATPAPGPTAAPTAEPAPTAAAPTLGPPIEPTQRPTTPAPTAEPTVQPTQRPTTPAPTAEPTVQPTPRPTIDPTAPPPPPTSGRPFAAPATSATYTVPASIDDTGATDVFRALNDWIDTVPNGSIIAFPAGGTFKLSQGIKVGQRSNLVFRGNGSTLRLTGSGGDHQSSAFVVGWSYRLGYWTGGSAHIAISNFTIVGNDPTPGTFGGGENQQAIRCNGSTFIEVSDVTVRAVYGDGVFVDNCNDVWVHDTHVVTAGRNGLTVVQGERVLAEDNAYDAVGYVTFDDEPNFASEASRDITFRNNTAGTWALAFVSIDGGERGAPINRIIITGNVTTGKAMYVDVDNGGAVMMKSIVFSNNRSSIAASGPRLIFAHVDGLTITGNQQPMTSGSLARITDCIGVTYP